MGRHSGWRIVSGWRFDLLLAAVLTGFTQVELVLNYPRVDPPIGLQVAAFLVMTTSVALRRLVPVLAVALVTLGLLVQEVLAGFAPVVGGFLAYLIVAYSLGRFAAGWSLASGVAVFLLSFANYLPESGSAAAEAGFDDLVGNLVIVGVLVALGRAIRLVVLRADRAAARARQAEQDREAAAARAVTDERRRIARELHDIVAHHISVMVLQAGAARQVLDVAPDRTRSALLAVERSGREAVTDMRRLLGILRRDEATEPVPPPTLADLPDLVGQFTSVGIPVELRVAADVTPLAAGVESSTYRIVQEALTNVRTHAAGASATVSLRRCDDVLHVEVTDGGAGAAPDPRRGDGTGHGLVGMRERVALYGGTLEAEPVPEGGFAVRARIPVEPVP